MYNNAVATGMVLNSIAVNRQKLKKVMLKIPVPRKYLISFKDLSFSLFRKKNNK
ncbi:hypothetical protein GCM10008934_39190 [Virgibacillus salarius]